MFGQVDPIRVGHNLADYLFEHAQKTGTGLGEVMVFLAYSETLTQTVAALHHMSGETTNELGEMEPVVRKMQDAVDMVEASVSSELWQEAQAELGRRNIAFALTNSLYY